MLRLIRSTEPAETVGRDRPRAEDPLRQVAREAARGQREAQRTLLVAVGPAMLRAVRGVLGSTPHDVEDTLQEAMVALHLAIGGFRGECTILHFACRIAVQTAMNARRRAGYGAGTRGACRPNSSARSRSTSAPPPRRWPPSGGARPCASCCASCPRRRPRCSPFTRCSGTRSTRRRPPWGVPIDTLRSRLRNGLAKLRARVAGNAALLEAMQGLEDGP